MIPNDRADTGTAAGWQQVQWNFMPGAGVNAPDAWQHLIDIGRGGGRGVVVAVLDTGVAYSNRKRFRRSPDFARGDFVRGYDFVDDETFPNDENGHGTHVAGTIGERTDNGVGVAGLAYGARIMPVRVLDRFGGGDSVDDHGRHPLGRQARRPRHQPVVRVRRRPAPGAAGEIPDILAALRYARRHDVTVVAASGNRGLQSVAYPARYETVIAVGATTEHACRRELLQRRPRARHHRAGRRQGRPNDPQCRPDLPSGRGIFQMTYPWAASNTATRTASSYRRFGLPRRFVGTSMAAPHVSATAALVISSGVLGRRPSPRRSSTGSRRRRSTPARPGPDSFYGPGGSMPPRRPHPAR